MSSTCEQHRRQPSAAGFTLLDTLFAVGFLTLLLSIATPTFRNEIGYLRVSGDAQGLLNNVALAKMRAASTFTQARLYADLNEGSYRIETWRKTGAPAWVASGGTMRLAASDTYSYGSIDSPPPDTQLTIGQAPACRDAAGAVIANTACIVFSSRGIPIATTGVPSGTEGPIATNALYISDGSAVYGVTVSATGIMRLWRTHTNHVSWVLQ